MHIPVFFCKFASCHTLLFLVAYRFILFLIEHIVMKIRLCFLLGAIVMSLSSAVWSQTTISAADVDAQLRQSLAPHPRLLFPAGHEDRIGRQIASDPQIAAVYDFIHARADEALEKPPITRAMIGRRMLSTSREVLGRVMSLGVAYRMTGQQKYADRARSELLAAAQFSDWHPDHYLDTAEMTAGVALGYDWFFNQLSQEDRRVIRAAIIEKGIEPSFQKDYFWIAGTNNWTQVCHGGLVMGALAIADEEPALAQRVIARAVNNLGRITAQYEPDGAYPEGPMYWRYGTTYHAMLISSLESALGTSFGLFDHKGLQRAPEFILHTTGPSGEWFNYSDSGPRLTFLPAMWWYAARLGDPSLLTFERRVAIDRVHPEAGIANPETTRFTPLILIWAPEKLNAPMPKSTSYVASGEVPIAAFRSSWRDDATWVAAKGGSAGISHAHMDVGSFVLDALGVRWAEDLGLENYTRLEQLKINLWEGKQGGQRWRIFRLGISSHNILVINGQEQMITGHAGIIRHDDHSTTFNLSEIYAGQLASALRTVELRPGAVVRIQDELAAPADKPAHVRWAFVTRATLSESAQGAALLTIGEKKLQLKLAGVKAKFATYSTKGPADYDAPNPDTRMVGYEFDLQPGEKITAAVEFIPQH